MERLILALALSSSIVLLAACGITGQAASAPPKPATSTSPYGAAAPPPAASAERLNGTVQSAAGESITLADGKTFSITPQTRVIRAERATRNDLQAGNYVAVTANRQPDNTLLATGINIFPESMRGVGPGQRPLSGGALMTNATIDQVQDDGFTVTFPGGGGQVKFAPDVQIMKLVQLGPGDVQAGMTVSALVTNGVAQSVSIQ